MADTLLSVLIWLYYGFLFFIMLPFVSLAFILTFPFDRSRRVANWFMFQFGRCFIYYCPLWKVRVIGRDLLVRDKSVIYISNHQSFVDMPLQSALPVRFKWISKKSLFSVPFMGWMMAMAGHIPIERGRTSAIKVLEQIDPYLKRGDSIMIFPEGTRSRDGELLSFKMGAFAASKRKGYSIQPVVIDGTSRILPSGDWRFKVGIPLYIKVLKVMNPDDYPTAEAMRDKAVAEMNRALREMRS